MRYPHVFSPIKLNQLALPNRIYSTAHAEVYAEAGGLPGDRYIRYYEEKAKGGLGMAICGGSSPVSIDIPQGAWRPVNLTTDLVIEPLGASRRGLPSPRHEDHDPGDPHGPALGLLGRSLAAPRVAVGRTRAGASRQLQGHGDRGHPPHRARLRRGREAGADVGHGRRRDLGRPSAIDRSVLVAGDEPAHRRVRRIAREPDALRHRGAGPPCARPLGETSASASECARTSSTTMVSTTRLQKRSRRRCRRPGSSISSASSARAPTPTTGSPTACRRWRCRRSPSCISPPASRAVSKVPVLHAQGIRDITQAERILANGMVDMCGMTRAQIADPHMMLKMREGREDQIKQCVGANYCIDRMYLGPGLALRAEPRDLARGDHAPRHHADEGREAPRRRRRRRPGRARGGTRIAVSWA